MTPTPSLVKTSLNEQSNGCARRQGQREKPQTEGLRLVFTSDGVVVEVVIRSVKRYDLVKIKATGSEAENTDFAYDQVKTALSESQAEAEE